MANGVVRTRIAPSPTGGLHVGTARAALFSELFARHNGGRFIVRIEDTDRERSRAEYEKDILDGLRWLGLEWDEGPDVGGEFGPYRQSERIDKYREALEQLVESGHVYPESNEALKFKVKRGEVSFTDQIRGEVSIKTDSWGGDFIIARSMDDPLYHLAVVVDDEAMQVSHVIRGEDHLTNTARHILLQRALGYDQPEYAHLPLLLSQDRKKLSKREGDLSLMSYRDKGYLPEAMLNYLALLGWNPGGDQEIFSHDDLVKIFELKNVQKGGAIFDGVKLDSINKYYLSQMAPDKLLEWGKIYFEQDEARREKFTDLSEDRLLAALQTEQERVSSYEGLDELLDWARPDWVGEYKGELLVWRQSTPEATVEYLQALSELLSRMGDDQFEEEVLSEKILAWIKDREWKNGDVLWPMRVALTGREHSPGPFEVAAVLGKTDSCQRIDSAIERLAD